jgi:hypothetical protein
VNALRGGGGRGAQIGPLHQILYIHRRAEQAGGDGKQVGPIGFKGFHAGSRLSTSPLFPFLACMVRDHRLLLEETQAGAGPLRQPGRGPTLSLGALCPFQHKHRMADGGASKVLIRRVSSDPKVAEDRRILATGHQSFEHQARFVCGQFARAPARADGHVRR